MKRLLPALLCAALLAGCGADAAAPAGPKPAPETAETAEPLPQGALRLVWQGGDTHAMGGSTVYGVDSGYYYDARFLTGLDLDTGVLGLVCAKPGCAHTDAGCDAWLGPSPADGYTIAQCGAFADGGKLYRVYVTAPEHGGGAAYSTLTVSALDGSGQTLLCEGFAPDGSCLDIAWLADDAALYAVAESNPPRADGQSSERTAVLRISKTDGGVQRLFDWSAGGEAPTAADVGQDGSVYTHPSESPVYAVIGLEEYLDGSQDWTLCTPPDLGPVGPAATR